MATNITYDEEKFKELIVYIAAKSDDDAYFGDVKLNKLLFYSDFLAYAYFGKPITGAEYQKQTHGPIATRLLPVRRQLIEAGDVDIVQRNRFYRQRVTVNRREPNTRLFDTDQIDLVDELLRVFENADASTLSSFTHENEVGWQLMALGEQIPYETVFLLPPDQTPQAALDWAYSVVHERNLAA